ncbi:MAG: substrate-binding domain-containing protein [Verrucomicrobiales bacterium]|nr:substrate-binding domain-containing protein [Verrucomicrobiales bacterium]MED5586976.1 substrate-binding domain-containing protein [Verrucomicrobiota bacterium]
MKKFIVPLITALTTLILIGCNKSKDQGQNTAQVDGQIVIVAELSGDGKRDKGFKAAEDALQRVPDIRGIFAINDPSGLGAVGALEKAGKLDQVTVIAFDGMPAGKQAIKEGKIYADPIQHPDKIGRECIKAIVAYLSGEDVKPNIDIPATLYTKDTVDSGEPLTPENPAGGTTGEKSRGLIGATCMDIANPFFKVIEENMRDEAAKHGYDLIYLGAENDVSKQQKQIKDFLVKEVVAIAVNPTNSEAIGTAVKEANNANVPVFSFDVRVQAEGAKVVSHVGTDNAQGGELAGQAMIDALGEEGGKVVIIDYRGVESCIERVKGFKKVIDAHNAKLQ